jgi:hypothetical protein
MSDLDDLRKDKKKLPYGKEPFNKCHEDYEAYDKKKHDVKEERDPSDWGPHPGFNKPKLEKPANNNSGVNSKKKPGNGKPGQGDKKPKPADDPNEKKTYLKHCYPEGTGPDADLINML